MQTNNDLGSGFGMPGASSIMDQAYLLGAGCTTETTGNSMTVTCPANGGNIGATSGGGQYCDMATSAEQFCKVVGFVTLPLLFSGLTAPLATGPALVCGTVTFASHVYQQYSCH